MLCLWNFNTNTFFSQQGRENLALYFFSIMHFLLLFFSSTFYASSLNHFFTFQSPKKFCHVANTNLSVSSRCWLPSACSCSSQWITMMFHNLRVEGRRVDNSHVLFFKVLHTLCTIENLSELWVHWAAKNQVHIAIKLWDDIFHTDKILSLAGLYLGAGVWRGPFFLGENYFFSK